MNRAVNAFETATEDFGLAFVDLQNWGHRADYDPNVELSRADAVNLIDRAEAAIIAFEAADATERKTFAVYALFRNRPP